MRKYAAMILTIAILIGLGGAAKAEPSYTKVYTPPSFGLNDFVVAVADFNGDGWDDIVIGGSYDRTMGVPADRKNKEPIYLLLSNGDGTFRDGTAEIVDGEFSAYYPIGVTGDFNNDGRVDLAVFDAGLYYIPPGSSAGNGYGNPPLLFLSGSDGRLHYSTALADAVAAIHRELGMDMGSDLHIKSASTGDVNNDGLLDIWVESCGGNNVTSHFMMNNGNGKFSVSTTRVDDEALHNPEPEFWREMCSQLVDLNNDGWLDLALGVFKNQDPTHVNSAHMVIYNNGKGKFPLANRLLLPLADFCQGFTRVASLTAVDLNGDGFKDLVLAHERGDDGSPGLQTMTGRYIQILINQGGTGFVDETGARMGDQSATAPQYSSIYDRTLTNRVADIQVSDVNLDGAPDLVMGRCGFYIGPESPLVHLNNGAGSFQVLDPDVFTNGELYFGEGTVPLDLNGDGVLDFVHTDTLSGPDGVYGTGDEVSQIITLVGAN